MRIILSGAIGRSGVGGQAWVYMQYLAGLRALGHDVYYLEDCGDESWVYNWESEELTTDLAYPAAYVQSCLQPLGFSDRWIYRAGDASEGLDIDSFAGICAEADLLLVRAVPFTRWRAEYDLPRRRAFIDVDPGFTQIAMLNGNGDLLSTVEKCERVFTFGKRIDEPGCPIPTAGRKWLKTVPPVSLPHWPVAHTEATHFTSIVRWRGFRDASYNGVSYGQRDREFPRFINLPRMTDQPFRIAILGGNTEMLVEHGWDAISGEVESLTSDMYRRFIRGSRAEFGVAKHLYVETRSGWFSDRSVCYLASGRPVLVQETGMSEWLPTGKGVVTFSTPEEALRGIESINADYSGHCRAAREVAVRYFAAERVLPLLLDEAMD